MFRPEVAYEQRILMRYVPLAMLLGILKESVVNVAAAGNPLVAATSSEGKLKVLS